MRNTHPLRDLGRAPAMKNFTLRSILRPFSVTNTILSVLPVSSLHVRMKLAIAHANNDVSISATWAPANFTWAQARVCPVTFMFISGEDLATHVLLNLA